MIADAERYREEDEALRRKICLRNALEEAVYRVKAACTDRCVHVYNLCCVSGLVIFHLHYPRII